MNNFKAVLFDFDGLLVDSEPSWDKAYDLFLEKHKLVDQPGLHSQMHGMGLVGAVQLLIDNLGLNGDLDELVSDFREVFYGAFLSQDDILMPGVIELLKKIKEKSLIASLNSGGHTKEKLIEMLKKHDVFECFSLIISSDDVKNGKPAPDIYIESVKQLSLSKDECLALEDSANGVLAAKAANIMVYAINSDEKMRDALRGVGADKVLSSLSEIKL